jgi:hypothetical protein
MGLVQRTYDIGSTPVPKVGRAFDPATGTFSSVPFVENKKIVATSTTVLIYNNI